MHESGFLACSPDGVGSTFTLEIKCPYKFRSTPLQTALTEQEKYIIYFSKTEKAYVINRKHDYYDQIQAQIHFCKKQFGVLHIWTLKENIILRVEKDPSWSKNIDLLLTFYFDKYLEYIIK